jgi:hypothetical protein
MPTDPNAIADYVAGWRERDRRAASDAGAWRAAVRARLPALVGLLTRDFGARRILLFGSLARGEAGPGSDLDLLVDGLWAARLIEATVAAERLLGDVDLDPVPTQLARPGVAARASAEGELLYGG